MRIKAALMTVGLLSLCACTKSLETRPGYNRTESQYALTGVEYALPMLQYEVSTSYKIKDCPSDGRIDFTVKAAAASGYVPGETFTIDYSALSGPMNTSDFGIKTTKGNILLSVNASAEDKTGDVIKSVVDIGLQAAKILAPVPSFSLAQSTGNAGEDEAAELIRQFTVQRKRLACSADTKKLLTDLATARSAVEASTATLATGTQQLADLVLRFKLRLGASKDRERLYKLQTGQRTASDKLAENQAAMTKLEKALSFADSRSWPMDPFVTAGELGLSDQGGAWAEKRFVLEDGKLIDIPGLERAVAARLAAAPSSFTGEDRTALTDLVTAAINRQKQAPEAGYCESDEMLATCAYRQMAITARLVPANPVAADCGTMKADDFYGRCIINPGQPTGKVAARLRTAPPAKGVFVRPPERARLLLCRKITGCATADGPLHQSGWDTAPQLGQLRFYPMKNKPFQSNALILSLREDGSIDNLQYTEKVAVAAAIASSASGAATAVNSFIDEREKERKEKIADARAEVTYERSEVAYQRSEVAYARTEAAAVRTDAAAVRADNLAKLQGELDELLKRRAIIAAEAVPQDFLNETAMLNAQIEQRKSQITEIRQEIELEQLNASRQNPA